MSSTKVEKKRIYDFHHNNNTHNVLECSEPTNYEGTLCSEELRQWQQCFSGVQTTDVLIPSNVDQQKAEDSASLLLSGIQFLSPSQECVAAIKPFMCLYLFGSCDYQNQLRQVSRSDCVELRDELCPDQWKAAIMLRGEGALPDCSMFEDIESQCLGMYRLHIIHVMYNVKSRLCGIVWVYIITIISCS